VSRIDHRELRQPLLLTVPGIDNSGPTHWQSIWEREQPGCHRVELGQWSKPQRNAWINRLNLAIAGASRPVVLIAHSLGCHTVAWWSALERPAPGKVLGALLVAPPEVEDAPIDDRLTAFAPLARGKLPFPSLLVASRNDPYAEFGRSKRMARIWGSRLVDAGPLGHINAESGIRDWPYGRYLLRRLIAAVAPVHIPLLSGGMAEMFAASADSRLEIGR